MDPTSFELELAALATLSSAQLRKRWVSLAGLPVPKISPSQLRLALAWEIQAKALGGYSRRTRQRLDQLAAGKTQTSELRASMRLVREWNGILHVVTVDDDLVIHWNDKEWNSLSEVARAITGTRWSGPAFFGLKQRKRAS